MRKRVAKRPVPRLSALTAVLLTLGFAGAEDGVVLCFGSDGHLAIEAVGPEGCAEVIKTAAHAASARAIPVSSSHCGPCVDVALTASTTTKGTSTAKRAGAAATAISIATPRPPISHLRAKIRAQHAVRFISEKPYTVVIRC